ncbi:MAG: hypothetical protein ACOYEG_08470 [Petrimonas sp.]
MKENTRGRKSYFSPEGKVALMILKAYTNFSDAELIEFKVSETTKSTHIWS